MHEALERKKNKKILIKEHKPRQALQEIKDIFLDAFSLQTPDESQPILEKISKIVEALTNQD